MSQFAGHLDSDHVRPCAEYLAQLDEGGSELGECQAYALFDFEVGDMLAVKTLDSILNPRVVPTLDPVGQAVFREHADDFTDPLGIVF